MTMAVSRLDRITTAPAGTAGMLARHAALPAAMKNASPGLIEMQLQKDGDLTWTGLRHRDSLASVRAAVAGTPATPRRARSRSPQASPWNTPRPSMRNRTQSVPSELAATPCRGRDARRRARPGRALAAGRGGERP